MRKFAVTGVITLILAIWLVDGGRSYIRSAIAAGGVGAKEAEKNGGNARQDGQQKGNAEELLGLEKRRQQLMEKEAALTAKEQEITRASAGLDAKIKELAAAQKAFEDALNEKKKKDAEFATEKYRKMLKVIKGMKPEESAKIIDRLDEDMAIGVLNQLDQKSLIKLSKFISQPRVVKWVKGNLETSR